MPNFFLQTRHLVYHLLKTVFAEQLMFLVLELRACPIRSGPRLAAASLERPAVNHKRKYGCNQTCREGPRDKPFAVNQSGFANCQDNGHAKNRKR